MLAPLRDYLGPRDPRTSPLLCATKDHYLSRLKLLGDLEPDQPGFGESRWITSEDVNAEHLLNVFTSFDPVSDDIWDACGDFMRHLYWHKPRSTVLRPRIEGLSDDHRSKPQCLFRLSSLLGSLGNYVDQKRLLTRILELERGQGDDDRVARTLRELADTNRMLRLYEEGIRQSKEALEIWERLGDAEDKQSVGIALVGCCFDDGQLDAAEEAGLHAMKLFQDQGREYLVCSSHRLLGRVYQSKGERGKAIQHFEAVIGIASPFVWHHSLFWAYLSLARLFCDENEFDNAQSHIEQAKSLRN
jgi:tetratricopeptide (TPR) repeat protein